MSPEIHYHFQVSDADFRAWDPKANGYAAWQPMTNEQRFQSSGYILDGSSGKDVSSRAAFTIRLSSSQCLVVYDPTTSTLIVLKAYNAMGVSYP
ncbi:hypothetical protein [Roseimicrobium sp. ORNL1]|uniref:hypothetical protein n=1 Tax=Roseimicrobium sp. ORNL1 TaxID=2711231 RepID=UPI0013E1BF88|nr:hypothetical protein [Roseimicrobium sp. ORNL1]QIF02135.1 hypothetical protein G5S37_11520 [Roseimicrobium sp. ORNL1]